MKCEGSLPPSIEALLLSPKIGDPYAREGMYTYTRAIAHEACRLQRDADFARVAWLGPYPPLVVPSTES